MKQVAGHVGGRNGRQTSKRQTGKVPRSEPLIAAGGQYAGPVRAQPMSGVPVISVRLSGRLLGGQDGWLSPVLAGGCPAG